MMNNNQTIEKLKEMRLGAMAELHLQHVNNNQLSDMTADEYLACLSTRNKNIAMDFKVALNII